MSMFEKSCGEFSIIVSPPSPRWVEVDYGNDPDRRLWLGRFNAAELHDLKYLIDRAIAFCEQ